jgi:hypothetical protein
MEHSDTQMNNNKRNDAQQNAIMLVDTQIMILGTRKFSRMMFNRLTFSKMTLNRMAICTIMIIRVTFDRMTLAITT